MPTNINYKDLDKYLEKMQKVPKKVVPIMRHTVYEGAAVLEKNVKSSLRQEMLDHGDPRNTKHLVEDYQADHISSTLDESSTNLHFMGYDTVPHHRRGRVEAGKPQPLKAATLESGRAPYTRDDGTFVPGIKATHFYSKAMNRSRNQVKKVMEKEFTEWITNAINEGE